ncbi:hypothetical protein [Hominifimenecus sp. rT4P-3]
MRTKLMIDGNAVYEVEEECLRRKKASVSKPVPGDRDRYGRDDRSNRQ